ncbi:MAG TPA: hypothetical protein VGK44_11690 [Casimicrobiaceae bacterium]|jgi:hypothetical protein
MKRILCTAIALALVLTACSTGGRRMFSEAEPRTQGYTAALVSAPNPTAPNIFVTAATQMILVDQEPIYPPPGDRVAIYFGLEQNGPYEFHSNGIEIQGNPSFCAPAGQFVVKCSYQRPAAGTVYKYKVRVRPVGGGPPLKDLDPTVMN